MGYEIIFEIKKLFQQSLRRFVLIKLSDSVNLVMGKFLGHENKTLNECKIDTNTETLRSSYQFNIFNYLSYKFQTVISTLGIDIQRANVNSV
jgi:hypothetical protein